MLLQGIFRSSVDKLPVPQPLRGLFARWLEGHKSLFTVNTPVENVGNLVCPSSYDLGEKIRVALLSVTEGEDKPLKYPTLFNSADAAVITKIDLAPACEFNRDLALANLREIRPGIRVFETSAKTGAGMQEWLDFLTDVQSGIV